MKQITRRLLPGQDVRKEIEKLILENQIWAAIILSLVGSLTKLTLRMADGKTMKSWRKNFEIVSATGILSKDDCHVHISASDKSGKTIGGHLKQGCIVGTTAELVVLVFDNIKYKRIPDPKTGYKELKIS